MRRVYTSVATAMIEGKHAVTLDGKILQTPGRRRMLLPTGPLAAAIAAEWQAQHPDIRPQTMPLTRLAATAIDRTAGQRDKIVAETANYAGTDLVCYRADYPPALAVRQQAVWQPLIDWATMRFDARLEATAGVIPRPQNPAALAAYAAIVAARDDFHLTALHAVTAVCGSLVIALALCERYLDAAEAFAASQLDESFQIEAWGEDAEAAARRRVIASDIMATARFLELLAEVSPLSAPQLARLNP